MTLSLFDVISAHLNLTSNVTTETPDGQVVSMVCQLEYGGTKPGLELTVNDQTLDKQEETSPQTGISQVSGNIVLKFNETYGCRLTDLRLLSPVYLNRSRRLFGEYLFNVIEYVRLFLTV